MLLPQELQVMGRDPQPVRWEQVLDVVSQLLQAHSEEIEQLVLLRLAERCVEEPLDWRKQHRLHRTAAWFVRPSSHEEPHERVQVSLLTQKQRFVLEPITEPVEPEWLWPARSLLLARPPCQAQEVRPRPRCLPCAVTELPEQDRLHREHLEKEVHLVGPPEEEPLDRLALRAPPPFVEPLDEERLLPAS